VLKAVSYQQHIRQHCICSATEKVCSVASTAFDARLYPISVCTMQLCTIGLDTSIIAHCFAYKQLSSSQIAAMPDGAPPVLKQTAAGQPSSFELELLDTCFSPPCAPNTIQPMNGQTLHVSTADKASVPAKQSANPEPNSVEAPRGLDLCI